MPKRLKKSVTSDISQAIGQISLGAIVRIRKITLNCRDYTFTNPIDSLYYDNDLTLDVL